MFCPFCGIKNNAGQQTCFVCTKKLPSLDAESPVAGISTPRPRIIQRPPAEAAPLRNRLLAASLDLLLIAAVIFVAGAALWSQVNVVRNVSRAIVIACAIATAAIVLFGYSWLLADGTVGKSFAGIRVIRREQPLSPGKRVGVIAFWMLAVGGAIWGSLVLLKFY